MTNEQEMREVLCRTLRSVSEKAGIAPPVPDESGEICLHYDRARICLVLDSYAYEIEISLRVEGGMRFSGDIIQRWLGEPVRAYSFNNGNVEAVARQAGDSVVKLLSRLREDFAGSLEGLSSAYAAMVAEARLNRIRSEAGEAWRTNDHKRVVDLYRSIEGSLSPLERKRLQLAERQLGG